MQGRPTTERQRTAFLGALARSPNVAEAARAAGLSQMTVYRQREADPGFATAWRDALDQSLDALEAEARRRALEGDMELVVSGGRVVMDPATGQPLVQRRRSDTLLALLLRADRPEIYRDGTRRVDSLINQSIHITALSAAQ